MLSSAGHMFLFAPLCRMRKRTKILIHFHQRNASFPYRERGSRWAMDNLKDWFEDCNSRNPSDTCPSEILTPTCSKELLNKWLCVLINETCSKTGYPYPTVSASWYTCSMRILNPSYPNLSTIPTSISFNTLLSSQSHLLQLMKTTRTVLNEYYSCLIIVFSCLLIFRI